MISISNNVEPLTLSESQQIIQLIRNDLKQIVRTSYDFDIIKIFLKLFTADKYATIKLFKEFLDAYETPLGSMLGVANVPELDNVFWEWINSPGNGKKVFNIFTKIFDTYTQKHRKFDPKKVMEHFSENISQNNFDYIQLAGLIDNRREFVFNNINEILKEYTNKRKAYLQFLTVDYLIQTAVYTRMMVLPASKKDVIEKEIKDIQNKLSNWEPVMVTDQELDSFLQNIKKGKIFNINDDILKDVLEESKNQRDAAGFAPKQNIPVTNTAIPITQILGAKIGNDGL